MIDVRKTDGEDEAEEELLLGLELEVPYHRHGHEEDPDVGDQVGDVCELERERECVCVVSKVSMHTVVQPDRSTTHIGKVDEVETFPLHGNVPEGLDRTACEPQGDGDADTPCDDEDGGGEHDLPEDGDGEDAVVEGEDAELDGHEGDVVEMAEDVVALTYQGLVVHVDENDVSSHPVRRAWMSVISHLPIYGEGRKMRLP